ncbi:hypothetical protein D9Q98_006681 [Chlorella vulgaris]|uniref:Uncharacterized protein n=1 Tax=Chlorella vulgaris TaxID=3077 RepID=A0A9D4TKY3_CHLVU|nr:hypothetical protein D9Q98_006681 [Chlorella vulgaris]
MAWSRGMAKDAAEMARKRHAAVASKRHLFMEAVTAMDADISEQPEETAVEWMVMAAWNWAQSEEEGKDESLEGLTQLLREALNQPKSPSIVLYAAVLSSLATAWGVAWAGSWWGVDAYRLLHDSPDWGAMAATWLAWTLPYVGGTAAAYFIAPSIITKSIIRPLVTDQSQFYRSVPFASFVFAAGCVAFSQNLVWQGLWQDVFINWMGGSRDPLLLTDPAQLEDSVRLSMGTLVGSPRLPAFLVAPAAALLTGLLEAGFFWTAMQARSINALIPVVTDDGNEEEFRAVIAVNVESSPLSPEELLLVSGRVALASSFLCLEGTLTGSLWLPIATSAAGLITAIQLSKRGSA